MLEAVNKGDLVRARELNVSMIPLVNAMGRLGGVTMVKAALRIVGMDVGDPRLPQVPASGPQIESLIADLRAAKVLS
jgi:4-hydroxy-tetrahydrodipicolinate synthase